MIIDYETKVNENILEPPSDHRYDLRKEDFTGRWLLPDRQYLVLGVNIRPLQYADRPVWLRTTAAGTAPAPVEEKPAPVEEKPAPVEEKPAPEEEKPAPVEEKPAPLEPATEELKPTAAISIVLCDVENEQSCGAPRTVLVPCETNIETWAARNCEALKGGVRNISTYGGNQCGDGITEVICAR